MKVFKFVRCSQVWRNWILFWSRQQFDRMCKLCLHLQQRANEHPLCNQCLQIQNSKWEQDLCHWKDYNGWVESISGSICNNWKGWYLSHAEVSDWRWVRFLRLSIKVLSSRNLNVKLWFRGKCWFRLVYKNLITIWIKKKPNIRTQFLIDIK